jgi:uncharacterized protein YuzE
MNSKQARLLYDAYQYSENVRIDTDKHGDIHLIEVTK